MILHSVFIYLKEDADSSIARDIKKSIIEDLGTIETVVNIHAGAPVGVDRDVVDNDYAMSLHAFFNDRAGLNAYLKNPVHLAFLERFKSSWRQIKVCDTSLD